MSLAVKKRRRRIILLLILVAMVLMLAGAWGVRKYRVRRYYAQLRVDGIAAAKAEHWEEATRKLTSYLTRNPNDAESLLHFAKARLQVPAPKRAHIGATIGALRRLLELEPGHDEQLRTLMELYALSGLRTEAIETSDRVLAGKPGDPQALRIRVVALASLNRFEEALIWAEKLCRAVPEDLEAHTTVLSLMHQMGARSSEIVARAKRYPTAEAPAPDDPRSCLLRGVAANMADDAPEAARWLEKAIQNPPAEASFVKIAVSELDRARQYPRSLRLLRGLRDVQGRGDLQRLLICRLWELGLGGEIVETLGRKVERLTDRDSEVMGIWGLSLAGAGDLEPAAEIQKILESRADDPISPAWAALVQRRLNPRSVSLKRTIEVLQTAVSAGPLSGYLAFWLGEAYFEAGETELAMANWLGAAQQPAWPAPWLRLATAAMTLGDRSLASDAARRASERAADDPQGRMAMLAMRVMSLPAGDSPESAKLLEDVRAAAAQSPADDTALALEVRLLVQRGHSDQAARVLADALAAPADLSETAFLRLAELSRAILPATRPTGGTTAATALTAGQAQDAFLARCEKAHGMTSRLALARAALLRGEGRPDQAVAFFESAMKQAASRPAASSSPAPPAGASDEAGWKVAWAQCLQAADDPRATSAWIAAGDGLPEDVFVQRSVLNSALARQDRNLSDRAIERLKSITGERAVGWRMARAQWLLGDKPAEKQYSEASSLLGETIRIIPAGMVTPTAVEARVAMARCLRELNNPRGAIEQLTSASNLVPLPSVILELAEALGKELEPEKAAEQMGRLRQLALAPEERRRAAALWISLGQPQEAIRLAEALPATTQPSTDDLLMQARLYGAGGRYEKVEPLVRQLLAAEKPAAAALELAAAFYASQGRAPEAAAALERLKDLDLEPGQAQIIRARHALSFGEPAKALSLARSAAEAAPRSAAAWQTLILMNLDLGKPDDSAEAARQAQQALGGDAGVNAYLAAADLLSRFGADRGYRAFFATILMSDADRGLAATVLRTLAAAEDAPLAQLVDKLRPLADSNPRFLPVQNLLAQMYGVLGRIDEALAITARSSSAYPAAAEPMQIATTLLARGGRWTQAAAMARKWRAMLTDDPLPADLLLGEALLQSGSAAEVLQIVKPYLARATADPDTHGGVLRLQAMALAAVGRAGDAFDGLRPLLTKSAAARQTAGSLIAGSAADAPRALAWSAAIREALPADDTTGRLQLAEALYRGGGRLKDAACFAEARSLLAALAARPDLSTEAVFLIGTTFEQGAATAFESQVGTDRAGDLAAAEAAYRQFLGKAATRPLELSQSQAMVNNNLAMLLLDAADADAARMAEALKCADAAVSAFPDSGEFRDTRAFVKMRMGDASGAAADAQKAIDLSPGHLGARIRLAEALLAQGQIDAAKRALAEVDRQVRDGASVLRRWAVRLDAVRARLGAVSSRPNGG